MTTNTVDLYLTITVTIDSDDPDWTEQQLRKPVGWSALNEAVHKALEKTLKLPPGATLTYVSVSNNQPDPLSNIVSDLVASIEQAQRKYRSAIAAMKE